MGLLERLKESGTFGKDIAVDLGTTETRMYVKGEGLVLREASVVAVNTMTNAIIAVGDEARRMVGRAPDHIDMIRPLRGGVSTDFNITEKMLRYFVQKIHGHRYIARPRVLVVAVPSGTTAVEQRAVEDASVQAGARAVYIIEGPLVAAIGAGIPIHEPVGNMVVDIGGGTTEVAVLSLGGIVTSNSIRVGGDKMDEAIIDYFERTHELMIGETTAQSLKETIGSVYKAGDETIEEEASGRDLATGLPKALIITAPEIRQSIEGPVGAIVETVKDCLDQTPPELVSDIINQGVILAGGCALIRGMEERIRDETGMKVRTAKDPMLCVAIGAGKCLEEFDVMKKVLISSSSS
jgi:rod shape-determining protein MreB